MRALLIVIALCAPAFARTEKTLAYPRDQAWPAAVRFVRVDLGLKIVEKDADAGYVLFELYEAKEKKAYRGSLEVVDVVQDGRHLVRFVLQIEDRPSWVEIEMMTKLERKLRDELGSPSPAPTQKPPPKKDPPAPEPPKDDGPPVSPTP